MKFSDIRIRNTFIANEKDNMKKVLKQAIKRDCEFVIINKEKDDYHVLSVSLILRRLFEETSDFPINNIPSANWISICVNDPIVEDFNIHEELLMVINDKREPMGILDKEDLLLKQNVVKKRQLEQIKDNNEQLEEEINELNAIINASFDEIFVTDHKGIAIRMNKATENLLNIKGSEIVGKSVQKLVAEGMFYPSSAMLAIKQKKVVTLLQTLQSGKQVISSATPIFKDEEIYRIVVNSRDITELNALKLELESKDKLLSQYENDILDLSKNGLFLDKNIVIGSEKIKKVFNLATKLAKLDCTVLVLGESGVGKEIIAETIHLSSKMVGPMIKVNCGAIPENLLESELFGYDRGAFTGADKNGKVGKIELASLGTLFLDEVGDLPLNLQVKLLRFLQTKEIMRLGGTQIKKINCRIIAATNANLTQMVKEGAFREDLYYRLKVVPISIPPLRERTEDILLLINHFMKEIANKYSIKKEISQETKDILCRYSWPGNVRELRNVLENLIITVEEDVIKPYHLPIEITTNIKPKSMINIVGLIPLKQAQEEVEKQLLIKALRKYKNTYKMAEILDCNQSTIVRKLSKYKGYFDNFIEHPNKETVK